MGNFDKINILKYAMDGTYDLIIENDKTRKKIVLLQNLLKRIEDAVNADSSLESAGGNLEDRINSLLKNYFSLDSFFSKVEACPDTKISYTIKFIHGYNEGCFWMLYFFYSNEIGYRLEERAGLPNKSQDYLKNDAAIKLYDKVNNDGQTKHNFDRST